MIPLTDNTKRKRDRFFRYASRNRRWVVRDYLAGDEKGITRLFQKVFRSSFSDEDWRWKYLCNPAGKAVIKVVVNAATGEIIGHQAAMPFRFKFGKNISTGYLSVDFMIEENFRRSGFFVELSLRLRASIKKMYGFGFGFPNKNAYAPTLKLGAQKILTLRPFFRILKVDPALLLLGHSKSRVNALKRICDLLKIRTNFECQRLKDKYRILEVTRFDASIDDLWNRISEQYPIAILRDHAYLNWRYRDNRSEKYKKFIIFDYCRILGYAVLAIDDRWGCRAGVLVDWALDAASHKAGILLWSHCESYLRSQKAVLACGLFSLSSEDAIFFRKAGFLSLNSETMDRKFDLMVQSDHLNQVLSAEDFPMAMEPKNWFLTLGDTDVI